MGLVLKIVLICAVLGGTLLGNLGINGGSVGSVAAGVIGIIIALIALTFLLKFLWRFIGCFSTILIAVVLIVILLLLTGTFDAAAAKLRGLFDGTASSNQSSGMEDSSFAQTPANYIPVVNSDGTTSFIPISDPASASPRQQARTTNAFEGSISAIKNGGRFIVGDLEVILYGIDAPDSKQICSDKRGRPYNCGQEAIRQLRRFTGSSTLSCKVKGRVEKSSVVYAVCNISNNDLGVAMVSEGWAFALPNVTPVYVPYEEIAKASAKGMWGGQFYKPAEWRAKEAMAEREAQKANSFFGNLFK